MVYLLILTTITLIGLIIATITDIKKREVPDWLSYVLIAVGLGLNLIFSIIYQAYWFITNSVAGFLSFLILALIMFYAGQWGGGDSKILMGLGALIGLDIRFTEFPFLFSFLINILIAGAVYGLMWSLVLAIKKWKDFSKEFKKQYHSAKIKKSKTYLLVFTILMLILIFLNRKTILSPLLLAILAMIIVTFYLWVFIKAIEKTSMIKAVEPAKLTEGDWIVKEIKYKGKYICGPKDLGIEKRQIKELVKLYRQKKIKKILIKEGIPFVPSFLIAFILTLIYGNILFLLI